MRPSTNGHLLVHVAVDVLIERQHYVSMEYAETTVAAVCKHNETLCVNALLTFHL